MKCQREESENQLLVINTGTLSSLSKNTLQIPINKFTCNEKIDLKLNGRKARQE